MKRPQLGAGGIFIFVLLLLAMVFIAAMFTLSNTKSSVDQRAQTAASLANAAAALEQFASQTGRLPCPANPLLDTGLADPNNASVNCNTPTGTLPWASIGMRRDDAIDAWGWKIGYRVYNGNGGMTQANGASMVNCDTVQALNATGLDGNSLCQIVAGRHDTPDTSFVVGKGFSVTDFGTVYDGTKATGGAAYVLLSFGPSGFGAYTSSGSQNPNSPKSTDEKNNLKAAGPFVLEAASDPTIPPSDNNHYDDILLYRTITDLAKKANLAARDWPDDNVTSSNAFTQSAVSAALGGTDPRSNGGNTGQSTLSFAFATVTGFDSTGSQAISFTSGSGGASDAIGVASSTGGGGNDLSSTGGEGLRFDFAGAVQQQLSVSLANFTFFDSTEVKFYEVDRATNVATLVSTVNKTGCTFSASTASFTVDAGATFNRAEIRPMPNFFGSASAFRVEEVRTCIAGVACQTNLFGSGPVC